MSKKRHKSIHLPEVSGLLRTVDGESKSAGQDMFDEIADELQHDRFQMTASPQEFSGASFHGSVRYGSSDSEDECVQSKPAIPSMTKKESAYLDTFISGMMRANVSAVISGRLNYPWKADLFSSHYETFPRPA